MRFEPALTAAFLTGLALLAAGQLVSAYELSAVFSLVGGALLIVVAIRGLAGLAGLHHAPEPRLAPGERVLVETPDAMVRNGSLLLANRGPYRARLTNRRILLSLKVAFVITQHDVTVGWLGPGKPLSIRSIEVLPDDPPVGEQPSDREGSGELRLTPWRRFGPRWRLWLPNAGAWKHALEESHAGLLR